ncbi:MAG: hypothetical protein NC120_04715 [Ruminococcus sp.]|nr:hypothetical protein [Ruminococcus sp.]
MNERQGNMRYNSMNMYGRGNMQRQFDPNMRAAGQPKKDIPSAKTAVPAETKSGGGLQGILNGIVLDEEKMLILLLIAILARNGADLTLLAALGYLLF